MKKFLETKTGDMIFRISVVIIANILLQLSTMWFLEPAHLYAGGATGLAQLILRVIYVINGLDYGGGNYNYFLALTVFIVNIPFLIIGWKYVSYKFALFSFIAVAIQVIVSILAPASSSPFAEYADNGSTTNVLALALMGGLLSGLAAGFALKFGTSTGGIDIIAQAVALHKGLSIGVFTLIANILIAIIGGGIVQGSWTITMYTCIRMIINSLVTDKVHTAYTYSALNIFTSHDDEISNTIMNQLNRGCTVMNVMGEYTHEQHKELYCVVSTYEVEKVVSIIKQYDPKAFVTISPVKRVVGNFIKKTIV